MQGKSLKPIVKSIIKDESIEGWRDAFFYEHLFTANGKIPATEAIRTSRWKYIRYLILGEEETGKARYEELFDLLIDPNETINLAQKSAFQSRLNVLREQFADLKRQAQ